MHLVHHLLQQYICYHPHDCRRSGSLKVRLVEGCPNCITSFSNNVGDCSFPHTGLKRLTLLCLSLCQVSQSDHQPFLRCDDFSRATWFFVISGPTSSRRCWNLSGDIRVYLKDTREEIIEYIEVL